MAKEVEEIEGGDTSSDALEYTEKAEKKEEDTSTDDLDREESTKEHRFEGGDDEWDKEQEGADLEDSGEEKEEGKEEKVEKEGEAEEKVEKKELSAKEKQDEKVKEDVINYLSEDGGSTKYVVKGKEYDLRDLSPQEFKDRFSKAGRFYERMEEMSAKEKLIDERERLAEDGARRSQDIMRRYGGDESGKSDAKLPDLLKPDDEDTDSEKSLKEYTSSLLQRVDKLEHDGERQGFEAQKQDLYRQLDSLEQEFPMLSKSEVIAVKSMPEYAGVDIRLIAENSHNARVSDDYLDSVFKARPDKFREIGEKAIEEHLRKNPNVRKVSRKKSSTTASGKVSSGKKKIPRTFDEIEAQEEDSWDKI